MADGAQPLTDEELKQLDRLHGQRGDYIEWMLSQERAQVAGPGRKVRMVTWANLHEICQKSGMDEIKMRAAYQHALETDDVLFAEWVE